jgi:hypothetical protein
MGSNVMGNLCHGNGVWALLQQKCARRIEYDQLSDTVATATAAGHQNVGKLYS